MEISRLVRAPRPRVFHALADPALLARWLAPEGMTGEVHEYDARPGGRIRMSLAYRDASIPGKSGGATDTFRGRVERVVPDEEVVWLVEFETDDVATKGEMRVAWRVRDEAGGTRVSVAFEGLPPGVDPRENFEGSRQSLAKLAALVERG